MCKEQIPSQKRKGIDQIPAEHKDVELKPPLRGMASIELRKTRNESIFERYSEYYTQRSAYLRRPTGSPCLRKNYKITIRSALTTLCMRSINSVFDRAVGSNLLRGDVAERNWLPSINPCKNLPPKRATDQMVDIVGTIVLHVPTGDSRALVMFKIFVNLSVPVLYGTSFMNRFITGIFSAIGK